MERNGRIFADKVDVKEDDIKDFFEEHTKKNLKHRYNYVLFQDDHPELAIVRDEKEKHRILPIFGNINDKIILDIGCGVGRWADALVPNLGEGKYIGIDFSDEMITKARKEYPYSTNVFFIKGRFQDINDVLVKEDLLFPFDIILVNGVSMYINDEEIDNCLESLNDLTGDMTILYFKESCGISQRFTLKDFYSTELTHNYNAIYRSANEYEALLNKHFSSFSIKENGLLFPCEISNRKETADFFWILKK